MEILIDAKFRKRNSQAGIDRFLSIHGFDLDRPIEFKPGPNRKLERVVQVEKKIRKKKKK